MTTELVRHPIAVGQVLTREMLDEVFREAFKRDEVAKQDGFEQVSWVNGYATCGVSVRDALLAKFGAAPQVKMCRCAPDGPFCGACHYDEDGELVEARAHKPFRAAPQVRECRHPSDRVQMLARMDTETVRSDPTEPPLTWSPICRACGADVPMANPVPFFGDRKSVV